MDTNAKTDCPLITRIHAKKFWFLIVILLFASIRVYSRLNLSLMNDNHGLPLIAPRVIPPLDAAFRPAILRHRNPIGQRGAAEDAQIDLRDTMFVGAE